MAQIFLQQSSMLWGLGLIFIFPLSILLLGEVIIAIQHRHKYVAATMQIIRNLVLPSCAVLVLIDKVLGVSKNTTIVQIVQTIIGICTIHALLLFFNGLLFSSAKEGTWQANTPKLFRDLIRFFLILFGTAILLSVVWNADLGGLFTALGVSSIVLGLALQDTLGNLFSGIALLFERPFKVGDWLEFRGIKGKVVEVNWRSVHLITRELELLVIPNGILAKEIIRNYRLPQKLHVEPVDIGFSYDEPPNKVKEVLKKTALATKGVLSKPEPIVQTINYNDSSIDYRIKLFLADYDKVPQIRDEFMTRIWYAADRNKIDIPFPIRTLYHKPPIRIKKEEEHSQMLAHLMSFPIFSYLESHHLEKIARTASLKYFGAGEVIIEKDTTQRSVFLIVTGMAKILILNQHNKEQEVVQLCDGDLFGEKSLISNNSGLTSVIAIADTQVVVIKTEAIQSFINKVPRLSRELGEIIEGRRKTISLLKQENKS